MKRITTIFNNKGQGIVEFALILALCVSMYMGLDSLEFKQTIRGIYDDVVVENVTKVYGLGDVYVMALDAWGKKTRAELAEVPDPHRLNADQQALINIGKAFIGKSLTAEDVYKMVKSPTDTFGSNHISQGKEVVIFNLVDHSDNDSYFKNHPDQDIYSTLNRDSRAPWTLHWMQGDYGTLDQATGTYSYTTDEFDSSTRYFYSDCMINDKSVVDWGNKDQYANDRTIRVSFTFKDEGNKKVVDSVRVRVNRGDIKNSNTHYQELDVKVTENYAGQYTPGATGVY